MPESTQDNAPRARPPSQERSRRTADRITAAALELLGEGTFETMSVGEIARRAGISVGGFYARFASKEALLDHLNHGILEGLVASVRDELDPERVAGLGIREIVRRYLALAVRSFRRHQPVLRQVALRSRTSLDPEFRERVRAANRAVHDEFRARLFERRAEIGHLEPEVAVDVGLTAVSGAMREYVLFQAARPQFDALEDDHLVAELTDLFCTYLRSSR